MEKQKRKFTRSFRFENQIPHTHFAEIGEVLEKGAKITLVRQKVSREDNSKPYIICLTYLFKYKKKAWKKIKKQTKEIPVI